MRLSVGPGKNNLGNAILSDYWLWLMFKYVTDIGAHSHRIHLFHDIVE